MFFLGDSNSSRRNNRNYKIPIELFLVSPTTNRASKKEIVSKMLSANTNGYVNRRITRLRSNKLKVKVMASTKLIVKRNERINKVCK